MSDYLLETIKKNLVKAVRSSSETMEFLTAQSREVFNDCKANWIGKQTKEDSEDREIWCEYQNEAHKKIEKYIGKWIYDLAQNSYITNGKLPSSIMASFEFIIIELIEYLESDFSYEITDYIMEIFINEEEKEYELTHIQGEIIP